jgi:ribosome biogenesis GTPase
VGALLAGRSTVLIGRSGVGKSTLLNALSPAAKARTGAVSRTEAGRHTTTRARLYRLDDATVLVDAPGMQQFGVQHIPAIELAATFRDFRPFLGRCRFHNCLHVGEPGCALAEAVERGEITPSRMRSYVEILASIGQKGSRTRGAKPTGHRQQQDHEQP